MWIGAIAALILPGAVTASASLEANAIRRVFRRHEAQIKYCYEQQLQKDRKLRGRLVLNATIDGNGRVSSVEISESELANDALHACITTAVRTWDFPVVGNHAIYTIVYPYVFEPAGK
jgi:TonB family protein